FLAEGAQAVHAALAAAAECRNSGVRVFELFVTEAALDRHPELPAAAATVGAPVSLVSECAAATLSETVTPQGLIAVCGLLDVPIASALGECPRLVVVLVGTADPGNAGTVIRVADAAGADAVLLAGDGVDPHNGKCVRASAGSVFHLPLARTREIPAALAECRRAGLRLLAATAGGELDLDDAAETGVLAEPCAWLFGNEAHGLPDAVAETCDHRVSIPIHGRAESLNLATAAAVCVYATARAQGYGQRP
ncbi:MAG: RNA methyltransferase, partial [Actinomycetota bacterium]|nr:RNA methyltransferase [Actinomycetota bacterium]